MKYTVEVESFDGMGYEIGGHAKEFDDPIPALAYASTQMKEPGWNSVAVLDPSGMKMFDYRFYNSDEWAQNVLIGNEIDGD